MRRSARRLGAKVFDHGDTRVSLASIPTATLAWRATAASALRNAPKLCKLGLRACARFPLLEPLGRAVVDGHFVAGSNVADAGRLAGKLRRNGVGCIVDESKEDAGDDSLEANAARFQAFLEDWAGLYRNDSTTMMVPLKPSSIASAKMLEELALLVLKRDLLLSEESVDASASVDVSKFDDGLVFQLSPNSQSEFQAASTRLATICGAASQKSLAVLLDAELWARQPAVDYLAVHVSLKLAPNGKPPLYNTYQAYLRGSLQRLKRDLDFASKVPFGAKIVRGAYLASERQKGAPLRSDKAETDVAYDEMAAECILRIGAGLELGAIFATHNAESCQRAAMLIDSTGLNRSDERLAFAQILGLCDSLTHALAKAGFNVQKLALFGKFEDLAPWFARRIDEHGDKLGAPVAEAPLLWKEVRRRLFGGGPAAGGAEMRRVSHDADECGPRPVPPPHFSEMQPVTAPSPYSTLLSRPGSLAPSSRSVWTGAISVSYTSSRPVIVFTAGCPGSGKTYVLHHIYGLESILMLDVDLCMVHHPEYDPTKPEALYSKRQAYEWADAVVEAKFQEVLQRPSHYSHSGRIVGFDGTGTNIARQIRRIKQAKEAGFWVVLLYVQVSAETALDRNNQRHRKVPEQAINAYITKLQGAVDAVLAEPNLVDVVLNINNDTHDKYCDEAARWGDFLPKVQSTSELHGNFFDTQLCTNGVCDGVELRNAPRMAAPQRHDDSK
ncbi:FAD-linked oxidoreductase-like protein [Pelagophyceae sp. CCMP2097]|nr:FAD-linked oxidoreductase-like protein [Pelagophyceae sp. CCMP2097]